MEKIAYPLIHYSVHPSEIITKIDPTSQAQRHLYCSDCILEANDPKSLAKILVSLDQFLDTAANSFSIHRNKTFEPLSEDYAQILSRQDEILDKITHHMNKEKEKVEAIFDKIKQEVLQALEAAKQKQLEKLDAEVSEAFTQFTLFKKQLQRNYPKPEDIESLFPSKEQLKLRLAQFTKAPELQEFVSHIQEEMNLDEHLRKASAEEKGGSKKKAHFDTLSENLAGLEKNQPEVEINTSNLSMLREKIQLTLEEFAQRIVTIKNLIFNINFTSIDLGSTILKPNDWTQIRAWIPSKYEFAPRLLYKGTRDGTSSQAFHSRCDRKGPTITVIKFKIPNTNKISILGGFTDVSWKQKGDYSYSTESFIFSLTSKLKCAVKNPHIAIYDHQRLGPAFGSGFDLSIENNFVKSQVHPYDSYYDTRRLIEDETYQSGYYYFNPEEVEVYALK